MYIAITGSKNNKDVYIYRSFRKENGKASSCIYKKLGKYNALLEQFDGNEDGSLTVESLKITLQALYNLHFLCQILCFYMYLFVIVWYTKRKKDFLSCI